LADSENALLLGVDVMEQLHMTDVPDRIISSGVRFDLIVVG
jgi:hypothetical protein